MGKGKERCEGGNGRDESRGKAMRIVEMKRGGEHGMGMGKWNK